MNFEYWNCKRKRDYTKFFFSKYSKTGPDTFSPSLISWFSFVYIHPYEFTCPSVFTFINAYISFSPILQRRWCCWDRLPMNFCWDGRKLNGKISWEKLILCCHMMEDISWRTSWVGRFVEGDFDAYVRQMRQPHSWGGEPELLMSSHVLK